MKYNTFIFDLDGTLLDTLSDLAASVNYALRQHGMPERTLEEIRRFVGNGVRLLMERAVPGGAQHPQFDAAITICSTRWTPPVTTTAFPNCCTS